MRLKDILKIVTKSTQFRNKIQKKKVKKNSAGNFSYIKGKILKIS